MGRAGTRANDARALVAIMASEMASGRIPNIIDSQGRLKPRTKRLPVGMRAVAIALACASARAASRRLPAFLVEFHDHDEVSRPPLVKVR